MTSIMRAEIPTICTEFVYRYKDGTDDVFPFRVGDLVRVKNWGCRYTTFQTANNFFSGSTKSPYYSILGSGSRRFPPRSKLFKIAAVVEHCYGRAVVTYIKDNENRYAVIGAEGLEPFKTYLLAPGETNEIVLDKLPRE